MADQDKQVHGNGAMEWRIKMADGSSQILVPEKGLASRLWHCLRAVIQGMAFKVCSFFRKAWEVGANDPRKVIHCLKVGMALTVVSLFYYMRPLYEGVGGNSMWAIMTVVVVFEHTAGATISKSLNRICGTSIAGFLAIGVHWVASQAGQKYEPIVVGVPLFLLASAATFTRFIPTLKARFDYGIMIFILTFSLVSVSGYRVDKLLEMAHQRISTIIIGTCLCILVTMLICPIWAGQELHALITRNMDKLANSLDGCVAQYFNASGSQEAGSEEAVHDKEMLLGYRCVLSSKATEDSMANFARWEPAHGRFNFRHPWKQYLKIGASMRSLASCIDTLNGCINSENKTPEYIKKNISNISLKVSTNTAIVIRELATTIKTMKKSSTTGTDILVAEMKGAAQELANLLKSYPPALINYHETPSTDRKADETNDHNIETQVSSTSSAVPFPLMEIVQVVTIASLLIQVTTRVEGIVKAVRELADLAEFKSQPSDRSKQNLPNKKVSPHDQDQQIVEANIQMV
ncbi:Aluminum-activated malate transporter [Quillaja saponaria]|uniref:Aluminum-activated malate transporter n=1 Tax=Quillaja saponaria TaxID=32244 RepID=A0AAD7L6K4_QUISA|nr:Aluminum-activated malate transporter [Quillaja saponaria]